MPHGVTYAQKKDETLVPNKGLYIKIHPNCMAVRIFFVFAELTLFCKIRRFLLPFIIIL